MSFIFGKRIGSTWFFSTGALLLGAYVAACSGKSEVEGEGNGKGSGASAGAGATSGSGASSGTGGGIDVGEGGLGSGAGNGMGGSGPACESSENQAELAPIYLAFAFDVSGSMGHLDCPFWNHDPNVKWTPVVEATTEFFGDASSVNINASMTLFPSLGSSSTKCDPETYETPEVEMQALPSGDFADVLAAYEEEVGLSDYTDPVPVGGGGAWRGGTPTLAVVDGTLDTLRPLRMEHPDAKVALVLVTDGVPQGCSDNAIDSVVASVGSALGDDGIPTYVIGVKDPAVAPDVAPWEEDDERVWACGGPSWSAGYDDVDNPRPTNPDALDNLDQIAVAGGTDEAILIDTGNPSSTKSALRLAIDRIRAEAVSCKLDRPAPPPGETFDPNRVNVRYDSGDDSMPLGFDPECEADDAWRYEGSGTDVIELCPSTCELIQADPYATIQVEFGCVRRTVVR